MKNRFLAMLAVAFVFGAVSADADPIVDQGQIFGTGGLIELSTNEWTQSITTGVDGLLTEIELQFEGGIPSLTPEIWFSIFSGGNPVAGATLFSQLLLITNADLDFQNLFAWDVSGAGLIFNVGDIFTFGIQATGLGEDDASLVIAGNDPPGYDGGNLYRNGVLFGVKGDLNQPRDIGFRTSVDPDIVSVPEPGSLALFVIGFFVLGLTRRKAA